METIVIITDISRITASTVNVSGITSDGTWLHLIMPPEGIQERWLYDGATPVIQPFVRVKLDLLSPAAQPPFIENWIISPVVKEVVTPLPFDERHDFIQNVLDPNLAAIFGTEIANQNGYFVRSDGCQKSMGMIRVANLIWAAYNNHYGSWNYRLCFHDDAGHYYSLPLADFSFLSYVKHLLIDEKYNYDSIGHFLTQKFRQCEIFLKIGLGQPDASTDPGFLPLEITGIYTFPDYLDSRRNAGFNGSKPSAKPGSAINPVPAVSTPPVAVLKPAVPPALEHPVVSSPPVPATIVKPAKNYSSPSKQTLRGFLAKLFNRK